MTEAKIEAWLGKQLKAIGCLYFKFVSPGNDGVPDRIVILPGGRVLFLELKAEDGKLSALQQHQIARLNKQGCGTLVVRGILEAGALARDIGAIVRARNEG
ncbi:MAG: VRR-NUC domain-containing protein [Clostridiales bacterium]|nr:VRR-NUC domain-containing protein [Clostridiales bacterium]